MTVTATEVVLETNSRERQKKMRAQIAKALGRRARHAGSEEQSQEELWSKVSEGRASDPEDATEKIPPEVAEGVLREYLTKHYSSWPDEILPALDGRTPRESVRTTEGRSEVEALIRDMERRSHGTPMARAYDFDDLRRELGLEPARGPLG